MKLKLKNTPEQVELIKALGSKDHTVAAEAGSAFAAFIGPVISKVIATAGTASLVFSDVEYDEDTEFDISKIESRKPTLKEFFFGFDED